VKEEVRDACEQAHRDDALIFGFLQQRTKQLAASTLSLRLWLNDDRAYLGEMGAVEMERTTSEEDAALTLCDREVPNVLADLGVVPAQQSTVARECSFAGRTVAPITRGRDDVVDVESLISSTGGTTLIELKAFPSKDIRRQSCLRRCEGLRNLMTGGTTDDIMAVQRRFHRDGRVEVLRERRAEFL